MDEYKSRARIAAIVPARNAAGTLPACLAAILDSTCKPDEIVLYTDGSTDGTERIAKTFDIRIITNDGAPVGPARARNVAARASTPEIYIFIDADVVVERNAIRLLVDALEINASVSAAFGSYDRNPPVTRRAAAYANLRHHWIHQNGERDAVTFWSGIGAVRAAAFWSVGGFDEASMIEDVDLGTRLRATGAKIRLVPEAQGSHCKDWSVLQLWQTDIFRRAVPWAMLLATGQCEGGHLNVAARERWSAIAAHSIWMFLLGCLASTWFALGACAASCLYVYLNRGLIGLLWQSGGLWLAITGAVLHWLYHLYASAVYVVVIVLVRTRRAFPLSTRMPSDVRERP